jgi:hypothetical protein
MRRSVPRQQGLSRAGIHPPAAANGTRRKQDLQQHPVRFVVVDA